MLTVHTLVPHGGSVKLPDQTLHMGLASCPAAARTPPPSADARRLTCQLVTRVRHQSVHVTLEPSRHRLLGGIDACAARRAFSESIWVTRCGLWDAMPRCANTGPTCLFRGWNSPNWVQLRPVLLFRNHVTWLYTWWALNTGDVWR